MGRADMGRADTEVRARSGGSPEERGHGPLTGETGRGGRGGRQPGRREFIAFGIGAFTVALAPGMLRPARRLVRRTVPVMGTIAEIAIVHRNERQAQDAADAAIDALLGVERMMTRFRSDSDIGRANVFAGRDAVAIDEHTARVVAEALRWAEGTAGSFDPALGRLIEVWDVGHRTEPPPHDVIARFADRNLYRSVEVGERDGGRVLRYHENDAALDLGGIAKGYGVDLAVRALCEWGIRDAIVNVGGDLYALGHSQDGDAWRVGIRAADGGPGLSGSIEVTDRAVATSGDYEQGFVYAGRRYHHLLDPRSAEPRLVAAHSLTIAASTCMSADAAATALFGQTREAARAVLSRLAPDAEFVSTG
jgi:FAD:protein FMN transferase